MAFVTLKDQSLDTMPWEEGGFPRTRYLPLSRKHNSALRLWVGGGVHSRALIVFHGGLGGTDPKTKEGRESYENS